MCGSPRYLVATLGTLILLSSASQALILTDPTGDQVLVVAGQPSPAPVQGEPQADVVSLTIEEGIDRLIFTREVAGPPERTGARHFFEIEFTASGHDYVIAMNPSGNLLTVARDGQNVFRDGGDNRPVAPGDEPNRIRIELPKELFLQPDALQELRMHSWALDTSVGAAGSDGSGSAEIVDVVPNDAAVSVALEAAATGAWNASSVQPQVYDSNGEAGVYVFRATWPGDEGARLRIEGPDAFHWAAPDSADPDTSFYVLIAAPGAHQHGHEARFWLDAEGVESGHTSRVPFGIRYTSTPVLTGHHDTLFLHASASEGTDGGTFGFLTTQPDLQAGVVGGPVGTSRTWESQPVSPLRTYIPPDATVSAALTLEDSNGADAVWVAIEPPGLDTSHQASGWLVPTSADVFAGSLEMPGHAYAGHADQPWVIHAVPYAGGQPLSYQATHRFTTASQLTFELEDVPAMLQDDPSRPSTNVTAPADGMATFNWPTDVLYGLAYCADIAAADGVLSIGNVVGTCEGGIVTTDGVERLWIGAGPPLAQNGATQAEDKTPSKSTPTAWVVVPAALALALHGRRIYG